MLNLLRLSCLLRHLYGLSVRTDMSTGPSLVLLAAQVDKTAEGHQGDQEQG